MRAFITKIVAKAFVALFGVDLDHIRHGAARQEGQTHWKGYFDYPQSFITKLVFFWRRRIVTCPHEHWSAIEAQDCAHDSLELVKQDLMVA